MENEREKEGRKEGSKQASKQARKQGSKQASKQASKEARKQGRKERKLTKTERKERRKETTTAKEKQNLTATVVAQWCFLLFWVWGSWVRIPPHWHAVMHMFACGVSGSSLKRSWTSSLSRTGRQEVVGYCAHIGPHTLEGNLQSDY